MKFNIIYRVKIHFFILLTIGVFSSCEKFLDLQPKESIDAENAITDKSSLNTAIRGLYRSLGAYSYYGDSYVSLGFSAGGDVDYNVNDNLSTLNFRPDAPEFSSIWASIYNTINIANQIIVSAPTITDVNLTTAERNQIVGEARFVRALAYFDLVRAWGGVPIKTVPTTDIKSEKIQRSSVSDVYAFIINDLNLAEDNLNTTVNRIRATKHAVWALKARYYLYTKNWLKAIEYSNLVIGQTGNYSLTDNFGDWFLNDVVQTRESIFEISFSIQNPSNLRTRMSLLANGGEYRYRPSNSLVNLLQDYSRGGERIKLITSSDQKGVIEYGGALYYRKTATDPSYVLRIAEQFLIRAEAYAELEEYDDAIDDINTIRDRAELPLLPYTTVKADILDFVLEERRLEFLWEAHRYFDLVRTGNLRRKWNEVKPNVIVKDSYTLLPIPIQEVELGGLQQNIGY